MIDVASWALTAPDQQLCVLLHELARYRPELLHRPRVVVASRADLAPDSVFEFVGKSAKRVSSVTGENIAEVLGELAQLTDQARQNELTKETSTVIHRPLGDEISISKSEDGSWLVQGRVAKRAVALTDITLPAAMKYIQDQLDQLGVERALVRAGAVSGDVVRVGELELEYHAEELRSRHDSGC